VEHATLPRLDKPRFPRFEVTGEPKADDSRSGPPLPSESASPTGQRGAMDGTPRSLQTYVRRGQLPRPLPGCRPTVTRTHPKPDDIKHNSESCNAIDIGIPVGTPVIAVADGTIGSQIGALQTGGDPTLLGLRLHLVSADNEWYYAHLSHLSVAGRPAGVEGRPPRPVGLCQRLTASAPRTEARRPRRTHREPDFWLR